MFTQHMDGYELSTGLLFHHVDIALNKQGYSYSPKDFLKFLQNSSERHFFFLHKTVQLWSVWEIKEVGFNFFFFFLVHCTLLDFFFFFNSNTRFFLGKLQPDRYLPFHYCFKVLAPDT